MINILNITIVFIVLAYNKLSSLKASSLYILVSLYNLEDVLQQKYGWPRTN